MSQCRTDLYSGTRSTAVADSAARLPRSEQSETGREHALRSVFANTGLIGELSADTGSMLQAQARRRPSSQPKGSGRRLSEALFGVNLFRAGQALDKQASRRALLELATKLAVAVLMTIAFQDSMAISPLTSALK